jgi:integral membrane protein (TIGR01906 family)
MSLREPVAGPAGTDGIAPPSSPGRGVVHLVAGILVGLATPVAILGTAAAFLVAPPVLHLGLDVAGSAEILGLGGPDTYRISDLTIAELVAGPGAFSFSVPAGGPRFYDPAEAAHLRDVRVVLAGFAAAFGIAFGVLLVALARWRRNAWLWRAIGRAAGWMVVAFSALGALLLVAFDPLFTLFHLVFFPGGNWAFDPTVERMVQLYPTPFWEFAAAVLAVGGVGLGAATWWYARRQATRLAVAGPT